MERARSKVAFGASGFNDKFVHLSLGNRIHGSGMAWRANQSMLLRLRWELLSTSTSIFVRRKKSRASSGRHRTGSFSLKEVFSTIGTEVNRW